jgi:hypothetical protein
MSIKLICLSYSLFVIRLSFSHAKWSQVKKLVSIFQSQSCPIKWDFKKLFSRRVFQSGLKCVLDHLIEKGMSKGIKWKYNNNMREEMYSEVYLSKIRNPLIEKGMSKGIKWK